MTITLTYDGALSRVRISATALTGSPTTATIDRSTDHVRWSTVRGGLDRPVTGGEVALDDYEFTAGEPTYYRVTAYAGVVQVDQQAAQITVNLDRVWLKSLARPFLNRPVTVLDYSDVQRPARTGVFDVIGRSYPVAVADLRGSRRWTLEVLTQTPTEADDIDLLLASGDPLLVQAPADCSVPGGYVAVGDVLQRRPSRRSMRRIFELPCTEVAAPGPDVVGATSNWQTVLNTYATWADVLAAHSSWADLMELIGQPGDVVVP